MSKKLSPQGRASLERALSKTVCERRETEAFIDVSGQAWYAVMMPRRVKRYRVAGELQCSHTTQAHACEIPKQMSPTSLN